MDTSIHSLGAVVGTLGLVAVVAAGLGWPLNSTLFMLSSSQTVGLVETVGEGLRAGVPAGVAILTYIVVRPTCLSMASENKRVNTKMMPNTVPSKKGRIAFFRRSGVA